MSWVKLSTTFLSRNSFGYFYMVGRMSVWPCVWVPQNAVRAHFYPNFEYPTQFSVRLKSVHCVCQTLEFYKFHIPLCFQSVCSAFRWSLRLSAVAAPSYTVDPSNEPHSYPSVVPIVHLLVVNWNCNQEHKRQKVTPDIFDFSESSECNESKNTLFPLILMMRATIENQRWQCRTEN